MATFLQTATQDWDFSSGNFRIVTDVPTETAQKLTNLFSMAKGTWYGDLRLGVPYVQFILVKNPVLNVIDGIFRKVIAFAPGAGAVLNSTLNFDARLRALSAFYRVQTNEGAVLTGGPGVPFVVTNNAPGPA